MAKFKPVKRSFDHQKNGLKWLWNKTRAGGLGTAGGAFFWDPGTGKTKAALDFVASLRLYRDVKRVLVLCPINAMQVWPDQMEKHIPSQIDYWYAMPEGKIAEKTEQIYQLAEEEDDSLGFLILNFAATIKRDKRWDVMRAIEAYSPDVLIVDESHHIKNATSKQSKAAHRIAQSAEYRLLLTGTPIGKNLMDMYSQMKAIDPKIWAADHARTGTMSWTEYKGRYGVWGGRTGFQLLRYANVDDLEARYQPHIRSVRKEDCHDMPKVTDEIIPISIPESHREAMESFAEDSILVWRNRLIDAPIVLTKLLRLQQMTGGWVHDETGEVIEFQTEKLSVYKSLLEDLAAADRKVIVFARFKRELDEIRGVSEKVLRKKVDSIRGGVSARDRTAAIKRFQRSPGADAIVVQVGSAEALDGIQDVCSDGIFYSTDYSLIHWNQARGRIDRTGQKVPVVFRHLHVENSVDGLLMQALKDKKDIERMVMDHPEVLLIDRG